MLRLLLALFLLLREAMQTLLFTTLILEAFLCLGFDTLLLARFGWRWLRRFDRLHRLAGLLDNQRRLDAQRHHRRAAMAEVNHDDQRTEHQNVQQHGQ